MLLYLSCFIYYINYYQPKHPGFLENILKTFANFFCLPSRKNICLAIVKPFVLCYTCTMNKETLNQLMQGMTQDAKIYWLSVLIRIGDITESQAGQYLYNNK